VPAVKVEMICVENISETYTNILDEGSPFRKKPILQAAIPEQCCSAIVVSVKGQPQELCDRMINNLRVSLPYNPRLPHYPCLNTPVHFFLCSRL